MEFVVIDCRFGFEYDAGHMRGSIHLPHPGDAARFFLGDGKGWPTAHFMKEGETWRSKDNRDGTGPNAHRPIIFYGEASDTDGRAAQMCRYIRRLDLQINSLDKQSTLHHPHMFVMLGGFSEFERESPELCETKTSDSGDGGGRLS